MVRIGHSKALRTALRAVIAMFLSVCLIMAGFNGSTAAPHASAHGKLMLVAKAETGKSNPSGAATEPAEKSCDDSSSSHHNSKDGDGSGCCYQFCGTGASLVRSVHFEGPPSVREPFGVHAALVSVVPSGLLRPPRG